MMNYEEMDLVDAKAMACQLAEALQRKGKRDLNEWKMAMNLLNLLNALYEKERE